MMEKSTLDEARINEEPMYTHNALNSNEREIRLLQVLPGDDCNTIECALCVVNFTDHPVYTALSYTWNTGIGDMHHIKIDGKVLLVGENLWLFLRQFRERKANDGVLLWVDAICIDQSNIKERNHQVAQMRDIYSTASSVIVWLGVCQEDDALAFDLMNSSRSIFVLGEGDLRRYRSHRQWNALTAVLNKPYWDRVWVIQEFVLAQFLELWCGSYTAEWAAVEHIFYFLQSCKTGHRDQHKPSAAVTKSRGWVFWRQRRHWQPKQANLTLRSLIEAHASTKSSDTRDKVYALLGLAYKPSESQHRIRADYSKSPVEVLVDVVRDQCHHSAEFKLQNIQDDHNFVDTLQRMLRVSNPALALYALRHAQDLPWLLFRRWFRDGLPIRLRRIGIIIESGFRVEKEGLTSLDRFGNTGDSHNRAYPLIYPACLSSRNASAVNKLVNDPKTLALLDTDLNHDDVNVTTLTSTYARQDVRPVNSFNDSSPKGSTKVFVGTDGIVGLTRGSIRFGDAICVFSNGLGSNSTIEDCEDVKNSKNDLAIIIRQTKESRASNGYEVVTIAKLVDHIDPGLKSEIRMFPPESKILPILLLERATDEVDEAQPVHDYRRSGSRYRHDVERCDLCPAFILSAAKLITADKEIKEHYVRTHARNRPLRFFEVVEDHLHGENVRFHFGYSLLLALADYNAIEVGDVSIEPWLEHFGWSLDMDQQ